MPAKHREREWTTFVPMRFYNPAWLGWWLRWSLRCTKLFWNLRKDMRRHPPMKEWGVLEIDLGTEEISHFPFRGKLMEQALDNAFSLDVKPLFGGIKAGETPAI